jgi:hypothetical protein
MTLGGMLHFICILLGLAVGIPLGNTLGWGAPGVCLTAILGLAVGWVVGFVLVTYGSKILDALPGSKLNADTEGVTEQTNGGDAERHRAPHS